MAEITDQQRHFRTAMAHLSAAVNVVTTNGPGGQAGITVSAVMATPPDAATRREAGPVPGTHLYEPVPLTGAPVTREDIAAAVAFFMDRRSGYITGQIMHCCGGASLLSSLSV